MNGENHYWVMVSKSGRHLETHEWIETHPMRCSEIGNPDPETVERVYNVLQLYPYARFGQIPSKVTPENISFIKRLAYCNSTLYLEDEQSQTETLIEQFGGYFIIGVPSQGDCAMLACEIVYYVNHGTSLFGLQRLNGTTLNRRVQRLRNDAVDLGGW